MAIYYFWYFWTVKPLSHSSLSPPLAPPLKSSKPGIKQKSGRRTNPLISVFVVPNDSIQSVGILGWKVSARTAFSSNSRKGEGKPIHPFFKMFKGGWIAQRSPHSHPSLHLVPALNIPSSPESFNSRIFLLTFYHACRTLHS